MSKSRARKRRTRKPQPKTPAPTRKPAFSLEALEKNRWFIPALILAGLCAALLVFNSQLSLSGDNAEFIILGRALASGQGYTYIQAPEPGLATKYPFGFPLLLAAVETLFPGSIVALKTLVVLLFALSLPVLYRFLRRHASPIPALLTCLLCLSSVALLDFSHQVMSEIPYLAASLLALLLLDRARSIRTLLFAVLALMGAYYIRTAGITLVAAGIAFLALNRRYKDAGIVAVLAVLLALPWSLRNAAIGGTNYLRQLLSVNPYRPEEGVLTLGGFFERLFANVQIYGLREIPRAFLPTVTPGGAGALFLGLLLATLVILYLVRGLGRRRG